MLVANLTALSAGLNQTHCQPVGRFAKVHEHCRATVRARSCKVAFLLSGAQPLVAALASSWRTALHSITSSARASSVGGTSRPSALAVLKADDEPEPRRLLDRNIGGFGSAQDLVEQLGGALEQSRNV